MTGGVGGWYRGKREGWRDGGMKDDMREERGMEGWRGGKRYEGRGRDGGVGG